MDTSAEATELGEIAGNVDLVRVGVDQLVLRRESSQRRSTAAKREKRRCTRPLFLMEGNKKSPALTDTTRPGGKDGAETGQRATQNR